MAQELSYDLVVLGGGSGGLQAAWDAATKYKAKTLVVDVQMSHGPPHYAALGGTCVNVGCVPKKLLVTAANYRESFIDAKGFGWDINAEQVQHSWKALIEAKNKAVGGINEAYDGMFKDTDGLDFALGWASVENPTTVVVRKDKPADSEVTHRVTAKKILVAVGGWPSVPALPGIEHAITSNEAFYLPESPKEVLVVGGGYIAVEFASIFYSFLPPGGKVSLAYRGELFLRGFDDAVRKELKAQMEARGVELMFKENPASIAAQPNGRKLVTFESGKTMEVDVVMYATGRKPNTVGLGLEKAGVALAKDGSVVVDELSKTNVDSVYAIGDVTNRLQLTPVAIREGSCFADTAFGGKPRAPSHKNVASAVFSIPQIGTCGLTEDQAAAQFKTVAVYQSSSAPLMHQLTGQKHKNFLLKIIVDHDTGVVLGTHLLGDYSAEIIQGVGIAMKMGAKLSDFMDTIGVHPTSAEEICSEREPDYFLVGGEKREKLE